MWDEVVLKLCWDPQVTVVVDGSQKTVEFSYQGLLKNTLRYTFRSRNLHALFDRLWHKLSISVQSNIVSIYMDCKLIERRLIDERGRVDPGGRMVIATRVENGRPVDVCFSSLTCLSIYVFYMVLEDCVACCLVTWLRLCYGGSVFVFNNPQLCSVCYPNVTLGQTFTSSIWLFNPCRFPPCPRVKRRKKKKAW